MSKKADYEYDEDGRPRAIVGSWAEGKIERIRHYIDISRAARRKFPRRSYAELFCGPGKCRIRDTDRVIDGSAVAAFEEAREGGVGFDEIIVADAKRALVNACADRLEERGAHVSRIVGLSSDTVDQVVALMRQRLFGLCLLDPFAIRPLPFVVVEKLLALPKVDLIVHVSYTDLRRNIARYRDRVGSPIDDFAPGWREQLQAHVPEPTLVTNVVRHWMNLVRQRSGGRKWCSEEASLVRNDTNAPIYWLFLIAGHKVAHDLWSKVYNVDPTRDLFQRR